jgi:hypothetical protein
MTKDPILELITHNAWQTSQQIQELLHGLGSRTQGAILADLVSLWIAGHIDLSELGNAPDNRPHTAAVRHEILTEWMALVVTLLPESESEVLRQAEPEGTA